MQNMVHYGVCFGEGLDRCQNVALNDRMFVDLEESSCG
jgi:hypothetical protein